MSGLTIRPVEPAELDAVLALNQANVPEVGSVDLAKMAWFAENALRFDVVVDERRPGEIGGMLILLDETSQYESPNYRWFVERYDRFLYVDRIAVDTTWRGQGVGRHLYEHAIAFGTGRWPRLCAEVNVEPPNEVSLRFHATMGFERVGEHDDPRYGVRVAFVARDLPATPD